MAIATADTRVARRFCEAAGLSDQGDLGSVRGSSRSLETLSAAVSSGPDIPRFAADALKADVVYPSAEDTH